MIFISNLKNAKDLGLKLNEETYEIDEKKEIFQWLVGKINFQEKKYVLLVNVYSGYSITFEKQLNFSENSEKYIMEAIRENLYKIKDLDKSEVDEYFSFYNECIFVKTPKGKSKYSINKYVKKLDEYFKKTIDYATERVNNCLISKTVINTPYNLIAKRIMMLSGRIPEKRIACVLNTNLKYTGVTRKVVIPIEFTFDKIHKIMQILYDWEDYHLHDFEVKFGGRFSILIKQDNSDYDPLGFSSVYDDFDDEYENESNLYLANYIFMCKKILYTYDFGDNWEHEIKYSKTIEDYPFDYPICLSGKGDTPEEDSGGAFFYDMNGNYEDYDNEEYDEEYDDEEYDDYDDFVRRNIPFEINYINERLKDIV